MDVKVGFAIAGGLSGLIMSLVGFDSGAATQPEGAIEGLRAFFSGLPILGTLVAIFVMRNYDVTEERAGEIRAQLDKRKGEGDEVKTTSYVEPGKLFTLPGHQFNEDLAVDESLSSKSEGEIQELFKEYLEKGIPGICFSPYLAGQNVGDILSEDQIKQRMEVIAPYSQWVRSFSCTDGNEFIPKAARDKGLKTLVGAWISNDRSKNEKEIENLIKVAKSGHADVVAVGNEVLLRGDISKIELINYIKRVKEALPDVPVGCVDTYYQYSLHPDLVQSCDIVLANCYPFWEGSQIDKSQSYFKNMIKILKDVAGDKPFMITETGWPSDGDDIQEAHPSAINAMKYFISMAKWSRENNHPVFYFSSFDESWKVRHEGDIGQSWGLWDQNGRLKYS